MKTRLLPVFAMALIMHSMVLYGQVNGPGTLTIAGDTCINSLLTVISNIPAQSITWTLNGTTVAGTQSASPQLTSTTAAGGNGQGSAPNQLYAPDRLYVDPAGYMYIPDLGNDRVQKWAPGAAAGATVAGGNGTGAAANQFNRPTGMFVDPQGNMYVADQYNERVQKWTPGATSGVTVAGIYGELYYPTDVYVDAQGNLYVSDQENNCVWKYPPGITTGTKVAGGYGGGSLSNQLSSPTGIFLDAAGYIYICDTDNNRVQKWAPGVTAGATVAGGNGYGNNPNQLANPLGLFVDCAGNIYVADSYNNRIQEWTPGATSGTTIAGGNGAVTGSNQLSVPASVFLDGDYNMYVADFGNNRVQKYSRSIIKTFSATIPGSYTATVTSPCGSATSNAIVVVAEKTPGIQILSNSRFVCPGVTSIFTATPTYGGPNPFFQWKKNGIDVGANTDTYQDNTLVDGDIITCNMASDDKCLVSADAISNAIRMSKVSPPDLGPDRTICPGTEVQLNAHAGYNSYTWQDGSTDSVFTASRQGAYSVDVTDYCQHHYPAAVTVSFYTVNTDFLPADTAMCVYNKIELRPSGKFSQYLWSDGSTGPSLIAGQPGLYSVEVTDDHGCMASNSILIRLKDCPLQGVYVPRAFTPDNNGRNDVFRPLVYGNLKKYEFSVYNRYGQVVFTTKEPGRGWDGRINGGLAVANTFVWYCAYQFEGESVQVEKGTVVLVR